VFALLKSEIFEPRSVSYVLRERVLLVLELAPGARAVDLNQLETSFLFLFLFLLILYFWLSFLHHLSSVEL
jgi:hypothetical protein